MTVGFEGDDPLSYSIVALKSPFIQLYTFSTPLVATQKGIGIKKVI